MCSILGYDAEMAVKCKPRLGTISVEDADLVVDSITEHPE
jgi:hypothetical protein